MLGSKLGAGERSEEDETGLGVRVRVRANRERASLSKEEKWFELVESAIRGTLVWCEMKKQFHVCLFKGP